jgi:hypothetical protein
MMCWDGNSKDFFVALKERSAFGDVDDVAKAVEATLTNWSR